MTEEIPKVEPRKKKSYLSIIFLVLATVAVGFAVGLFANQNKGDTADSGTSHEPEQSRSAGEVPSADVGRMEAVKATEDLLNSVYLDFDDEEGYMDAMEKIQNEGYEAVLPDDVSNRIHFVDIFEGNENAEIITYQTLLALSAQVTMATGEEISLQYDEMQVEGNVLYDESVGIAYVPVSAFAKGDVSFSLQMVYVDGEWKLAPYSLIESVQLSASLGQLYGQDLEEGLDIPENNN